MKKIIFLGFLAVSLCTLSSCSVVMAANKEGTNISKVQHCKNRSQFIAKGGKIVSSERMPNGDLVELYQFTKERGSIGRAFMHGVLDVWTLGLWEVVGTPMEGFDTKEFFCLKVISDCDGNVKDVLLN